MAALCVVCCLFTVKNNLLNIFIDANDFNPNRFLHLLSTHQDFDILRDLFAF